MALIECLECGKQFSDRAPACVHCGYPSPTANTESTPSPFGIVPQANLTVRGFQEGMLFGQERYELVSRLGRGGFGEVWKAKDKLASTESRDVFVAVKLIPPDISRTPREIEGIKKNYALVEGLVHQHIAALKGLIQDGDDTLLLMECVDGCDLVDYRKQYIEKHGSFPDSEAIRIGMQIAQALDYAHSKKVLHRDIKPENIMITTSGDVKVLDFGLAAEIQSSMNRVSMAVTDTSGTRPYMSPEQWQGKPQGQASDQYSLAVLVYEMLCGELPFVCDDTAVLRECVLKQEAHRKEGLSERVWSGLEVGLSKEQKQRFSTCKALISEMSEPGSSGHSRGKSVDRTNSVDQDSQMTAEDFDIFAVNEDHLCIWVRDLLRSSGCDAYIGSFKKHGITGEMFFSLNDQDLINIGIDKLGDRKRVLELIEHHNDQVDVIRELLITALIDLDPQSQYSLGCEYAALSNEFSFQPNRKIASHLFRQVAQNGTTSLMLKVADIFARGDGVEKDRELAATTYGRVAEESDAEIQMQVADRFSSGNGIDQDYGEAAKWYEKAAEQGGDEVRSIVAEKFSKGDGVEQNYEKSARWYRALAKNGDAEECLSLANRFSAGDGVNMDKTEAAKWYDAAAEQGDGDLRREIADIFSKGERIDRDLEKAKKWYLISLESASPDIQFSIAEKFFNGDGVMQDYKTALQIYTRSASLGCTKSQMRLSAIYSKGIGVEKDRAEAFEWCLMAAESGNPSAQYNIAECYRKGCVVEKDNFEAESWYRKAASQGHEESRNLILKIERSIASRNSRAANSHRPFEKKEGNDHKSYMELPDRNKYTLSDSIDTIGNFVDLISKWGQRFRHSVLFGMGVILVVGFFAVSSCNNTKTRKALEIQQQAESEQAAREAAARVRAARVQAQREQAAREQAAREQAAREQAAQNTPQVYTRFPFSEEEAKRRQKETAQALGLPIELAIDLPNDVRMDFVFIPPGKFLIGSVEYVDSKNRDNFKSFYFSGSYISSVDKNSPAEKSGLLPGDIIVGVNGQSITGDEKSAMPFFYWEQLADISKDMVVLDILRESTTSRITSSIERKDGTPKIGINMIPIVIRSTTITKPFYMAKYECTQEQWLAIIGENPSRFRDNKINPVESVSWNCIKQKFLPAIQKHAPDGMTFRLPTEAQWEYACRAGTSTRFHFGAAITTDQVNFNGNYPYGNDPKGEYREKTTPVGTFAPNAWGLHDMHGNLWEWCRDRYDINSYFDKASKVDPESSESFLVRTIRGGSFDNNALFCRSAARSGVKSETTIYSLGFRLALELK